MESQQDNVEQLPTQVEVIVLEEQTQQPQEQMPLRRSTRERRNVVPDDYIVFLQEHEDIDGLVEGDPINFHQAMQDFNSKKWIDAMNEEYKSMQDNQVWDLIPYLKVRSPLVANGYLKLKGIQKVMWRDITLVL